MPDDVRAARIAYFNQLRVKQLLGLPLAPEEKEYLERVATMQAAQKLSKPLDLEIGPVRIHPPLDLEIGPAQIHPPLDLEIGPARIHDTDPATAAPANGNVNSLIGALLDGVRRGAVQEAQKRKYEMLIPNASVPPPVEPGKPGVIMARPGEAVGIDESGRSIDIRGKPVANTSVPAVVTPYGDVPMRTGELRASDITSNPFQAYRYGSNNAFIEQALEAEYGEHLKAMEDNRDENGMPTDKFPAGYFKGKSKREQQNIKWGVEALRRLRRGTRI